jgi:hypothetical protein
MNDQRVVAMKLITQTKRKKCEAPLYAGDTSVIQIMAINWNNKKIFRNISHKILISCNLDTQLKSCVGEKKREQISKEVTDAILKSIYF